MDFFKKYSYVSFARSTAFNLLLDNHVASLPVKLLPILNEAGIKLIKNSLINELKKSESGLVLYDGNTWYIVYDDTMPYFKRRFVIAHELGHIVLGHINTVTSNPLFNETFAEQQADMFALRLLAPACVLAALQVYTPDRISSLCQIPLYAANKRSQRLADLKARNAFFSTDLERRLFNSFIPFIDNFSRQ